MLRKVPRIQTAQNNQVPEQSVEDQILTIPHIHEHVVEVMKEIRQELVSERVVEQIVIVPQILKQKVEVVKMIMQMPCHWSRGKSRR